MPSSAVSRVVFFIFSATVQYTVHRKKYIILTKQVPNIKSSNINVHILSQKYSHKDALTHTLSSAHVLAVNKKNVKKYLLFFGTYATTRIYETNKRR